MSRLARIRLLLAATATLCAGVLAGCAGASPVGGSPAGGSPGVDGPLSSASPTSAPSPTTPSASTATPATSATAPSPTPSGSKIPWPPETSAPPTSAPPTSAAPARVVVPSEAAVGACVNINSKLPIDEPSFAVVPCTALHQAQVVGQGTMPEGYNRDVKGAFTRLMVSQCDPHFASYTGTAFKDSKLVSTGFAATKSEYAAGNRTVVCLITMRDRTPFSGDARGKTNESEFGHSDDWKPPGSTNPTNPTSPNWPLPPDGQRA